MYILLKESLNSDGHQFYQYQQNEQSSLNLTSNIKKKNKKKKNNNDIYDIGNSGHVNVFSTSVDLVWFMAFNATFNNIPVISWRSVLLEEAGGKPPTCRKSLTNFIT